MKLSWNKVRDRSTSDENRVALLKRMVEQMSTHVLQVTLRHDASRIVQTILQFGDQSQKDIMLGELAAKAYEISKTPYGHFTILKAITYCTRPTDQKTIASAFRGHFVALGTNVIGSRTVESIMQLYPPALTRPLKAEFYGQKFCILLPEPPKSLRALIEALPAKESSIMDHMRDLVQKLVNKSLLEFTYVHNLLWEYAREAASSAGRMEDLVAQLAESAPKLLSTKPGARVMCLVISHASAKDRKRILKTLKGHVLESLCHESAYLGIMRLVDVTDDTVNVQKSLFDELRNVVPEIKYTATGEVLGTPEPPLLAIAKHRTGHKLLLRLLSPSKRHLEPDDEDLFTAENANSKKAPELRRKEHLTFLKAPLVAICAKYAEELARSRAGSRVLEEVIFVLHPRVVVDALARVFAGMEQSSSAAADEDDSAMFVDGDDEEDDEEEEDDDEDGDEFDMDGEDEEGDEFDEDEPEDEEEVAEDAEEHAQDMQAALKKGKGAGGATPAVIEEAKSLPIQEDPVAHGLLKRLLQFEAAVEQKHGIVSELSSTSDSSSSSSSKKKVSKKSSKPVGSEGRMAELQALLAADAHSGAHKDDPAPSVEEALWADAYDCGAESEVCSSLGQYLIAYLKETDRLRAWAACNRPCFALVKLLQIPSAQKVVAEALTELKSELSTSTQKHEGGKLLSGICDAISKL